MVRIAAGRSAGSFVSALLSMAALLRSGVAIRDSHTLANTTSSQWWNKYCIQFSVPDNCEQTVLALEAECDTHFEAMAAADNAVSYGILRYKRLTARCERLYAAKEDIIYEEQHPMPDTIRRATQACGPLAMEVCKTSTCPTFCALKSCKEDCDKICERTSKKMWGTGSIDCAPPKKWSQCIGDLHAKLMEDNRIPELEAISREHILKCVCVSRLKDDDMCYQGGQGIPEGQKWCEFNKNPSWRRLLKSSKPSAWQSDWLAGNQPQCNAKEVDV